MGRYSHLWTAEKGQGHLSVKAKREERDRTDKDWEEAFFASNKKGTGRRPITIKASSFGDIAGPEASQNIIS